MDFLNKLFDAKETAISDSSRKLYTRNLKALNGGDEIKNLDFLEDVKKICESISHLSDNTKKSYLISICTILKNSDKKELYDVYFSLLKDANSKLSVNTAKSKSQEENWLTQDYVNDLREKLKKIVPKKISIKEDYENLLNYLLISLYTLTAPRRNIDYCLMYVSNDMNDSKKNYLDFKNKKFIFNNYKTSGTYKSIEVDIPDELFDVIKLYLKNHIYSSKLKLKKYDFPFLLNADGAEFTSDKMTKRLNKIFDKKVSSSLLRNIFLTDKYSDVMNELKKDTAEMSTSVKTALNNYIKSE